MVGTNGFWVRSFLGAQNIQSVEICIPKIARNIWVTIFLNILIYLLKSLPNIIIKCKEYGM